MILKNHNKNRRGKANVRPPPTFKFKDVKMHTILITFSVFFNVFKLKGGIELIKELKRILKENPKKRSQVKSAMKATLYYTSSDDCEVTLELYPNQNIIRYVITGIHSNVIIAYDTKENRLTRKPRGVEPFYTETVNYSFKKILN